MICFRFIRYSLIAAAVAIFATGSANACPFGTNIVVQNTGLSITTPTPFDPFSGLGKRESGTIVIDNSSGVDCTNVSLTFTDSTTAALLTAAGTNDEIPFKITTASGSAQLINDVDGIFIGTIPAGTKASVDIDLVIDAAASVPGPGNPYSDDDITLVLSSPEAGQPLDQSKELSVSTSVDTLLDINVGGAAYIPGSLSAYTMEFGTLSNGASKSVNVTVHANVGHQVTVSSAQGGVMVGPAPGSIETHTVAYIASFAGSTFSLESPVILPLEATSTALTGSLRAFEIQITDIGSARAGSYQDTITLTVEGAI